MSKSNADFAQWQIYSQKPTVTQTSSKNGQQNLQHIAPVSAAQSEFFYHQTLVQSTPIQISSDGTFSNLEPQVELNWFRTIPQGPQDTVAASAARIFYSHNEFELPAMIIPSFVARQVGVYYRPSELVMRLAVLYSPPPNVEGNNLLAPLLSMPRLQNVRMVFRDHNGKGGGPYSYLRPSALAILELQKRMEVQLLLIGGQPVLRDDETRRDITRYIGVPTAEDEQAWVEGQKLLSEYTGPSASCEWALTESGWKYTCLWEELGARVNFRRWAEEQRVEMLASQDVEMS